MTKLEDIEAAVAKLAPSEFDRFQAWFEELRANRFDEKIARDAENGRLDRFAEAAVSDFRKGRIREL